MKLTQEEMLYLVTYTTLEDMVKRTEKFLPIFEEIYLACQKGR